MYFLWALPSLNHIKLVKLFIQEMNTGVQIAVVFCFETYKIKALVNCITQGNHYEKIAYCRTTKCSSNNNTLQTFNILLSVDYILNSTSD